MKSTVVNGRMILVSCSPCTEKIQAGPKTFLANLDSNIATGTHAGEHSGEGERLEHAAQNHDK